MSNLKPLGWMRHRIDVWETMRNHLDLEAEALLARLFDVMHREGNPISSEPAWLSRACRVSPRMIRKHMPGFVRLGFVTYVDDGAAIWANYVEDEFKNADKLSKAGRKGSDARWQNDQKDQPKSAGKRTETSKETDEKRDSFEDDPNENPKKRNENKETDKKPQWPKESDTESEGAGPSGQTPDSSSKYTSSSGKPDAHKSAPVSNPVCPFKVGSRIKPPNVGEMRIDKIGFDGVGLFLELKEISDFDMDSLIVPLDHAGVPNFSEAWWNDTFPDRAASINFEWSPKITTPPSQPRRKRRAA